MQFFNAYVSLALLLPVVLAVPRPAPAEGSPNAKIPTAVTVVRTGQIVNGEFKPGKELTSTANVQTRDLEKRGAIVAVLGIAGTAAITKLTEIAIEIGTDTIKNLGEWNEVGVPLPR